MQWKWEQARQTNALRDLASAITVGNVDWRRSWNETEDGIPAVVEQLWDQHGMGGVTAARDLVAQQFNAFFGAADRRRVAAQITQWVIGRFVGHEAMEGLVNNVVRARGMLMRRYFEEDLACATSAIAAPVAWQQLINWESAAKVAENTGLVMFLERISSPLIEVTMFVCDEVRWQDIEVNLDEKDEDEGEDKAGSGSQDSEGREEHEQSEDHPDQ